MTQGAEGHRGTQGSLREEVMLALSRQQARRASQATPGQSGFGKASLAFGEASHCKQWREKLEEHQTYFTRPVPAEPGQTSSKRAFSSGWLC